jgi:transposase
MILAGDRLDLTMQDLEDALEQVRPKLTDKEYGLFKAIVSTVAHLVTLLERKRTTIARLRGWLFGATTEKTKRVLERIGQRPESPSAEGETPGGSPPVGTGRKRRQVPGHGRHGAAAYTGAERVSVPHAHLNPGDRCPDCPKGRVYKEQQPGVAIRLVGQAPVGATVAELDKRRCNACGQVFTATPSADFGSEKYDATAVSMVALCKYGHGMPFYRQAQLQASVGIPLPASTQWRLVEAAAKQLQPAMNALTEAAAQGTVLHNDDTTMRVLTLQAKAQTNGPDASGDPAREVEAPDLSPDRTGVFTSGIVATGDGHRVALFFTGRRHAGENLATVLAHRVEGLAPPIQMCDALSRNVPKAFAGIVANCLNHARRNVVDVAPDFPTECRFVLETLKDVYRYDELARQAQMSPDERLRFHQSHSGPLMTKLHDWLTTQLDDRLIEPNSGLGDAITYFMTHWAKLTRFLEVAGAPLHNNICERALKRAILHRKNALFYKTSNGARVGDLFMSLIHTCDLNRVNAFDYLTALQRHADAVARSPASWLPWTYRPTRQQLRASSSAA